MKTLLKILPEGLFRLAGLEELSSCPKQALNVELHVSRRADTVYRVEGPYGPVILHAECEAKASKEVPRRVLGYNTLLEEEHGLPVISVLYLLKPPQVKIEPHYRRSYGGNTYLDFSFRLVRLYEQPVEAMIEDPTLVALAPLSKGFQEAAPSWLRAAVAVANRALPPSTRGDVLNLLQILGRAQKMKKELVEEIINPREAIMGSSYAEILAEGIEKGIERGMEKGRAEGKAENIRQALGLRFKRAKFTLTGLEARPIAQLDAVFQAVLTAESAAAFRDAYLQITGDAC